MKIVSPSCIRHALSPASSSALLANSRLGADHPDFVMHAALLALIFGACLVANPYYGIWHDSILYTAQALNRLHPEIYGHDLFFRFGSQDSFTLFPAVHAWAISNLGIEKAALTLTALGKVAWFAGLLVFSSAFLRGLPLWLGLAVVVTYPPFFDSHKVFSYGESFATSRIFAESLVLSAVGLLIRGRATWAAACVLLGASLHPLVALPGMLSMALLWRWKAIAPLVVTAACVAAVALLLAVLGVDPFARVLVTFDPEWFEVVTQRNNYVFLDTWDRDAFGRIAFLFAILIAAYCRLDNTSRHLAGAMLGLGVVTLLAAWLGGPVVHNVLITQLQLWRGLWLVQMTALLLLGGLTPALWSGSASQRVLLLVLWSAALLDGLPSGMLAMSGLAGWLLADRFAPDWKPSRVIQGLLVLMVSFALVWKWATLGFWITSWGFFRDRSAWLVVASDTLPVILVTGAMIWSGRRFGAVGARISALAGAGMLALAMWAWDAASPMWDNPTRTATASALQSIIPTNATVFWPDGLEPTWFWLRRAHYASGFQTAGVVFSRETALEARRRQQRLWALGFEDGNPYWDRAFKSLAPRITQEAERSPHVAAKLCRDAALDYLVLPLGIYSASVSVATFSDPLGRGQRELIDCKKLRYLDFSSNSTELLSK